MGWYRGKRSRPVTILRGAGCKKYEALCREERAVK
jgi:hypothetical protein